MRKLYHATRVVLPHDLRGPEEWEPSQNSYASDRMVDPEEVLRYASRYSHKSSLGPSKSVYVRRTDKLFRGLAMKLTLRITSLAVVHRMHSLRKCVPLGLQNERSGPTGTRRHCAFIHHVHPHGRTVHNRLYRVCQRRIAGWDHSGRMLRRGK